MEINDNLKDACTEWEAREHFPVLANLTLRDHIVLAMTLEATRESLMVAVSYLLDLSLIGQRAGSHVLLLFSSL